MENEILEQALHYTAEYGWIVLILLILSGSKVIRVAVAIALGLYIGTIHPELGVYVADFVNPWIEKIRSL